VALILKRGSEVFLIRRFNTGSEDGLYGCAGVGVDAHESVTQAIIREAYEELGIVFSREHLKVVHIVQRRTAQGQEMIGFFFETCEWQGIPCINANSI
jgi:ADP-ribose pyrophosphatase YjhB (NUDIX family)